MVAFLSADFSRMCSAGLFPGSINLIVGDFMQTLESLRQLVAFNVWANRRMIASLKAFDNQSAKAVRALSHFLVAEKEWMTRMLGNGDSTGADFWKTQTLDEGAALAEEMAKAYTEFVADLSEETLESVAVYKNSKGIEYKTSFRDILTHVLFHSMAHRGQVAMALRADGGEPIWSDYIVFLRELDSQKSA
jgi:uncharacterized damage-inducible protein DinB